MSSAPDHDQRRAATLTGASAADPIPQPPAAGRLDQRPAARRPAEAPTVSATDHGLVVGDGVFEALKVTDAGAFAVRRHLARLTRSARRPRPAGARSRPAPRGHRRRARPVATSPTASSGSPTPAARARSDRRPRTGRRRWSWRPRPPTRPPATTAVVTAPWSRNEHGALAGVKSTSYAENVRALAYAAERGAGEAIFLNTAGNVCEGTGTNIFCVFGDEVVTPPLTAGPLAGITRELLLEWCDDHRSATSRWPRRWPPTRCSSRRRCGMSRASTGGTTRRSAPNGRVTERISRDRSPSGPEPTSTRSATMIMFGTRPTRWDMVLYALRGSRRGDWRSGSALRSHRRGHWFEPSIAHQARPLRAKRLFEVWPAVPWRNQEHRPTLIGPGRNQCVSQTFARTSTVVIARTTTVSKARPQPRTPCR